MSTFEIQVENIKCGGCANSIRKKLLAVEGVEEVSVDIDGGAVSYEGHASVLDRVKKELGKMGYPEVGSLEGMNSSAAKAKSFVSCAIGRLQKD